MTAWPRLTLGELCDLEIGRTPPRAEPRYWGEGHSWLSIGDMKSRDLSETRETITEAAVQECRCRLVPTGTLVMSFKLSVGKVGVLRRPMYTNEAIVALRFRDPSRADVGYTYHALRSTDFSGAGERAVKGITLNLNSLSRIRVPLPPPDEQRRIAAMLDRADALRSKREKSLQLFDEFLRSAFLEMFGDPVRNEKGWEVVRLGDQLAGIDSGWSPKCLDRPARESEWGILKLGAVTSCEYLQTENKALKGDDTPRHALEVKAGDLLMTRKNTGDLVAACAYVLDTRDRLMIPDLVYRLRLKNEGTVLPTFLWYLLIHPGMRRRVQSLARGSAGSMPNISKGRLAAAGVPMPPKSLQQRFDALVLKTEGLKRAARAQSAENDRLFGSLAQRAFGGEP